MFNPDKKFDMNILQICPPHLSDVATLPWEIKKMSFFNIIIRILQIIYFILDLSHIEDFVASLK